MLNLSWLMVILFCMIPQSEQQLTSQQLKVVRAGQNPVLVNAQFVSTTTPDANRRNAAGRFSGAERICAAGMWAMYNNVNYGEGLEGTTTVISVRATDPTACTTKNSVPGLTNVQSVNFLGNANPQLDGLDIYSEPYFLGGAWKLTTFTDPIVPGNGITGVRMGSVAITVTTNSANPGFRLCADLQCNTAVCIDMSQQPGGMYFVRNTLTDTSVPWPRVIRTVQRVTSAVCGQDLTPPILGFSTPPQNNG